MARTPSNMLPLGTPAPDFSLPDTVSGKNVALKDFQGSKALVVMFICNHCPFVKHVNDQLVRLANEYQNKNIGFVAISSNDVENYPEDAPELMKKLADELSYPFPYLYDESQEIAKSYDAACTPDFFIFNEEMRLIYRGQLDDSRPGNDVPVSGKDIRKALDNVLEGMPLDANQKPSLGCNIKWK